MSKQLEKPRVSVIVPTHNRADWLPASLGSVLEQTYKNFEVLVVDDASTDNTEEVVKNFCSKKIRYFSHESQRGAPAARNTGLDHATGEFIAFLDDDDQWLPEKLALQVGKFDQSSDEVGLIYTYSAVVSSLSGETLYTFEIHPGGHQPIDFLESVTFTSSVPLIRRSSLSQVGGFDEALASAQDKDMWIRLAGECAFDYVPEVMVKRFVHGGQITADLEKKIAGREQILHKYCDLLSQKPETLAKHLWRLGVLYCTDEQFWKGRRCFIEAIRQQPRRKGTYKHLLLAALAPEWHRRYLLRRYMGSADGVRIYY